MSVELKVGRGEPATILIAEGFAEAARIQVNVDGRNNLRIMVNGHSVAMVKLDGTVELSCHSSDPEKDKEIKRLKVLGAEYSKENERLKADLKYDAEIIKEFHDIITDRPI